MLTDLCEAIKNVNILGIVWNIKNIFHPHQASTFLLEYSSHDKIFLICLKLNGPLVVTIMLERVKTKPTKSITIILSFLLPIKIGFPKVRIIDEHHMKIQYYKQVGVGWDKIILQAKFPL